LEAGVVRGRVVASGNDPEIAGTGSEARDDLALLQRIRAVVGLAVEADPQSVMGAAGYPSAK